MEQFRVQYKFEYEWTDEFFGDMEEVRSVIMLRRIKYPNTEYRIVNMSGWAVEIEEPVVNLHNLEITHKDSSAYGGWLNPSVTETVLDEEEYVPVDPKTLTCYECCCRDHCRWVDDEYNTDGDCLALK
jgi:hypothetical protein